ncbi:ligase-associated DNA damage response endonuclease PdeM [Hyphococcus flavus]|uniref:Ligase-associated DNA damage response endonuclease PdeM n=1 Tax=Hyphococcus flavus TaxID=1866326 RepID=A0AAE9ZBC6_9PROT|nr:ligase-associated DNA damage response endonuclease PdeM [Hyphococcus flavus]WDI31463.1 ligase-associated DNA damage response endonuclease PdeM [Hyphococcus flavus]
MSHPGAISIHGEALTPDPLGAIYWVREETLIVSDLHFEKGSSFAARGVMLPPYDTRTTLMRLAALIRKYAPKRVISLGDAFHDEDAEDRMDEEDASSLEKLMRETAWLWILGNHDPEPPARFAAACEIEMQIGALTFRHEPLVQNAPGEIAGHLHPCARVVSEGRILRRRCFVVSSDRMIMPAMGAYTGGLNILDRAYAKLFSAPVAWVMGADGVYPITAENLAPDMVGGALGRAV